MSKIHTIPKHPTNSDETLDLVLNNIVFCNLNNSKLLSYEIKPKEVVLKYER